MAEKLTKDFANLDFSLMVILLIKCDEYDTLFKERNVENIIEARINHVGRALIDGCGLNVPFVELNKTYSDISNDIFSTISRYINFPRNTSIENSIVNITNDKIWIKVKIIPYIKREEHEAGLRKDTNRY